MRLRMPPAMRIESSGQRQFALCLLSDITQLPTGGLNEFGYKPGLVIGANSEVRDDA